MDAIALLQRLGWEWRPDGAGTGAGPGVLFTVKVSGQSRQVFVPLQRVWIAFDEQLQAVGCMPSASVGAPFTVGGFFSFVKKAANSVAKKVVPKAVQKAASKVVSTAKAAVKQVQRLPILGNVATAAFTLSHLPQSAALQLLQGKRIDHIAVDTLKQGVKSARTLAPYVQTVISVVPGVGQGLSAGIGAAGALAEGQTITQAVEAAVKGALPGGPLAQAAFEVASGAMQGKPIDQIALNALPIPPAQKQLLARGISAAKDLAAGKRADQVLLDQATRSLPPELQKAVAIGTALGHAKTLQGALGAAAHGASQLAGSHAAGLQAAQAFASGVRTPAVVDALHRAQASKVALTKIVKQAQAGHPQAKNIINALQRRPSLPSLPHLPRVAGPFGMQRAYF